VFYGYNAQAWQFMITKHFAPIPGIRSFAIMELHSRPWQMSALRPV